MSDPFYTRGFAGQQGATQAQAERIPPGQYLTQDFPMLSAGPVPLLDTDRWTFRLEGLVRTPAAWIWEEFLKLPSQSFTADISCVTRWTKLDTAWQGVSLDRLLEHVELQDQAAFVTAFSHTEYTANLRLEDLAGGRAFIATHFDGRPLTPEHGGPARLVVPHLFFWKSVKWAAGLRFTREDRRGFWESAGYHNHGDPWKEERYSSP